jgi:hypothetical protein
MMIFHQNCDAQTRFDKSLLIQTWKLQNMTTTNGKQYFKKEELPNELIQFNNDSLYVRKRGTDKLEGKWYFDKQGYLVIEYNKFTGNQNQIQMIGLKDFWIIKQLDNDELILIYQEREGNNIIHIYNSVIGN